MDQLQHVEPQLWVSYGPPQQRAGVRFVVSYFYPCGLMIKHIRKGIVCHPFLRGGLLYAQLHKQVPQKVLDSIEVTRQLVGQL